MKRALRADLQPLPLAVKRFFAFMQERESIRLKRARGEPPPWTKDSILQQYRFTNVKREHDRTSRELIAEFYKPNYNAPREQLLLNCAIARYFGTIEFMRAIGWQETFKPKFIKDTARSRAERDARVFTGAYIIPTAGQPGYKENVIVDQFLATLWKQRQKLCEFNGKPWTAWQPFLAVLMTFPGFGGSGFMAKEVTLDTRYTSFWPKTPIDVNTWTPIGPGSQRGAARIYGDDSGQRASSEATLRCCRQLYAVHREYLPKDFVKLELHDIQFQLCEFSKYERIRGGGHAKSRFHPHVAQQLKLL